MVCISVEPSVLQSEFLNVEIFPSQPIWNSVVGLHLLQHSDGHLMDLAASGAHSCLYALRKCRIYQIRIPDLGKMYHNLHCILSSTSLVHMLITIMLSALLLCSRNCSSVYRDSLVCSIRLYQQLLVCTQQCSGAAVSVVRRLPAGDE